MYKLTFRTVVIASAYVRTPYRDKSTFNQHRTTSHVYILVKLNAYGPCM